MEHTMHEGDSTLMLGWIYAGACGYSPTTSESGDHQFYMHFVLDGGKLMHILEVAANTFQEAEHIHAV